MEINQAAPKFQDVSIAPMHTAEHLLNATMVKTFGCLRSRNAHIERKKSKCDYILSVCPTEAEIQMIEDKVNAAIDQNLPVTVEFLPFALSALEIMTPVPVSDYMYPILQK